MNFWLLQDISCHFGDSLYRLTREGKRKRDPKRVVVTSKVIPSSTWRCNARHYRKYNTFSPPRQFPKISESLLRKIPLLPHVDWPRRANYRTGLRQKWSVYKGVSKLVTRASASVTICRVVQSCTSCLYKWHKSTRELLAIEFITRPF